MELALVQTIATVVVGIAGIASTAWVAQLQTAGQRKQQRLLDVRSVAARVLSAARDTETNLVAMNWTWVHYKDGEKNAGKTRLEWMMAYNESNRQLRIAADELLLLEGDVQKEVESLLDSLQLGRAPEDVFAAKGWGGEFESKRNGLREKLRGILKL